MLDLLFYLLMFGLLALLVVGGLWLLRSSGAQLPVKGFFGERPEKRLAVVEHANVDGRRLVLVRRDDVEHLIMTGGPVDVLIEANIGPAVQSQRSEAAPATFVKPARTFGRIQPTLQQPSQDVAE